MHSTMCWAFNDSTSLAPLPSHHPVFDRLQKLQATTNWTQSKTGRDQKLDTIKNWTQSKTGRNQKLDAIKNWMVGRRGSEAMTVPHSAKQEDVYLWHPVAHCISTQWGVISCEFYDNFCTSVAIFSSSSASSSSSFSCTDRVLFWWCQPSKG